MKKLLIGGVTALAFALPFAASAATNITFLTLNGGPNVIVPLGQTVQGNVTYDLSGNSTQQSLSWQVIDSAGNAALPPVCVTTDPRTTAGTYNSSFSIGTGGQTEGTWRIRVKAYGDPIPAADTQCQGAVNDTFTSQEILTITSPTDSATQTGNPFTGQSTGFCALFPQDCLNTNSGLTQATGFGGFPFGSAENIFCTQHPTLCGLTSPTGTNPSAIDTLTAQVTQLAALVAGLVHPTTAVATTGNAAACAALADHMIGTQQNARNSANGILQGFLIGEHMSIPLLQNNQATYGFWGTQTNDALNAYKSANSCI